MIVCTKCNRNMTQYSPFIGSTLQVNIEKIKFIAKITGTNYIIANQMLTKDDVCILTAEAPEIKKAIEELKRLNISFEVTPDFKY